MFKPKEIIKIQVHSRKTYRLPVHSKSFIKYQNIQKSYKIPVHSKELYKLPVVQGVVYGITVM